MPPRKPITRDPIPPDVLHDKIKTLRPDMHIKQNSIWVAIIHHTADPRDIQFDSLLWIKAHPLITLRTLKYHYYSRNPLEELALQYRREVPDETLSLKDIRPSNPRDNVIVLRALDGDKVTDAKLRAGIKFNDDQGFMARGRHPETAIDVDSDDDDEPIYQSTLPLNEASIALNDSKPQNGQSFSIDQHAYREDAGAGQASQVGPSGLNAASTLVDAKVPFKALTEIAQEPSPPLQSLSPWRSGVDFKLPAAHTNGSPSAEANMAYEEHMSSPPPQAVPASARSNLPEPITPGRQTALHTPQTAAVSRTTPSLPPATHPLPARKEYNCAMTMCKARVHPNEWTHYEKGRPLCMGHSAGFYRSRNQMHNLQEAGEWIVRNAREKDFWRARGYAQSKNEDHLVNKPAGVATDFSDLDSKSSMASPTERKSYEKGSLPLTRGAGVGDEPGMASSSGDGDGDGDTEAASSDAASSEGPNTDQHHVEQPVIPTTHGQSFVPEEVVGEGVIAEDMVGTSAVMPSSMVSHQDQMPTTMADLQTSQDMGQPTENCASLPGGAGRYSSQETVLPQANRFAHGRSPTAPPGWPFNHHYHQVTAAMAGPQGEQGIESTPVHQAYYGLNQNQMHMGMASNRSGQVQGQAIESSPNILQANPGMTNPRQMARAQSNPGLGQQHTMRASRDNLDTRQAVSSMSLSPGHFRTDAGMTNMAHDGHNSSFSDIKRVPDRVFSQGITMNTAMGLSPGHFQTGAGVANTVQGPPFHNERYMHMGQNNRHNSHERGMAATPQWGYYNQLDNDAYQMGANTRGTQRGQGSSERWQSVTDHGQSMAAPHLTDAQIHQQQEMYRLPQQGYGGRMRMTLPTMQQPVSSVPMGWSSSNPQPAASSWSQSAGNQRMCLPEFDSQHFQGGQMADYNGALLGTMQQQPQGVGDGSWSYPLDEPADSGIFGTAQDWSGRPSDLVLQDSEADVDHSSQQGVELYEQQDFKQGSGGKRLADMMKEGGSNKKVRQSDEAADDEMYAGLPDDAAAARDDPTDGDYVDMDTSVDGGNNDDDYDD